MSNKRKSYFQVDNREIIKERNISMDICIDCGNVIIDLHEGATQCKECVWLEVRTHCKSKRKELANDNKK